MCQLFAIEKFKNELTAKLEALNQASKNRTTKIKDICTEYFSQHEENVREIQGKVTGVTKAFDEWKMYVMNPQSINEARIHSLDVKWDEIEVQVNHNFSLIYNIVKKLLFSLQKQVLTHSNTFTFDTLDDERSIPSRLGDKTDQIGMNRFKLISDLI